MAGRRCPRGGVAIMRMPLAGKSMKNWWMLLFGVAMMAAVTALAGMAVMDETDLSEVTGSEGIHVYSWIGHGEGTISLYDTNGVSSDPAYAYTGVINWLGCYIDDGRGVNVEFRDLTLDMGTSSTGKSIFKYGIPDIDGEFYFSDICVGTTAGTGRADFSTWQFGNFSVVDGSCIMIMPK